MTYNKILEFVYLDEEKAIVAVYNSIAYQANVSYDIARKKTVISSVEISICQCGKSSDAIRGSACINGIHCVATRLYCNQCGRLFYPEENFH